MSIWRSHFDEKYFTHPAYQAKVDSIRNRNRLKEIREFQAHGRLLEIGFGNGAFLTRAAQHFQVEGMDLSPYALQSIPDEMEDKVRVGNIETTDLPNDGYDVIVILNVLEHLQQPGAAVQRIYKGLRQGGIMFGSVPNKFSLIGTAHAWMTDILDRTHVSTWSMPRWRNLFADVGFSKTKLFGEIMFGKNYNFFIKNRLWPHTAFNLMFLCRK